MRLLEDYRQKTKGMTREEKLSYTMTYYWYDMLGVAAAVFLPVFLIVHVTFGMVRPEFTLVMMNQEVCYDRDAALREEFAAWSGLEEKRIEIDSDYRFSYGEVRLAGVNETSYEKFFFRWQNGELDAVLMPESFYRYCVTLGGEYEDLTAYDTGGLALYEDGGKPTGVLVEGRVLPEWITNETGEKLLLVFPETGGHDEMRQKFLDYICENSAGEGPPGTGGSVRTRRGGRRAMRKGEGGF